MKKQSMEYRVSRVEAKIREKMHRAFRSIPHTPYSTRSRGFTLLLAALVASIVLSLGASVFSIAQKQVTLSSIGRDSQYAFYAADTAAECALYYDIRFQAFGSTTPASTAIVCDKASDGSDLTVNTTVTSNGTHATSTFAMDFFSRNVVAGTVSSTMNCAEVTIAKNPTAPHTVIHADGYSTSCAAVETSPRSLQRSVELRY